MKKLPKLLHIRWNYESDEPFIVADSSFAGICADLKYRDSVEVGIYQLKSVEQVVISAQAKELTAKRGPK